MSLKILCSGHLIRHPLGGHTWHHLQYLVGLHRLGHEVMFVEDFGWPQSCYDPARDLCTDDPSYGIGYMKPIFQQLDLGERWCYLAADGAAHGVSREQVGDFCRDCDVYFCLSNINWLPELEQCHRRVLVDTDPVFTQIGGHGMGGPFSFYHRLFTYGENVHKSGCEMPTAGQEWLPTRQPVVLDLWPVEQADPRGALTTVVNWTAYGDQAHDGKVYGQKDRQFREFFDLPHETGEAMQMALGAPAEVTRRFIEGGWKIADPLRVSETPFTYQRYLRSSRGEFCVAKHGYVETRCGWFSDRSCGYLASGRPVLLQDTGFSDNLPCGQGLLRYRDHEEAVRAVRSLRRDYDVHCRAARAVAEEHFDSRKVLGSLLERSL